MITKEETLSYHENPVPGKIEVIPTKPTATQKDLQQTIETTFLHCNPGGAALFAPDHILENFHPSTEHGGHDGDSRSMRYMEWSWDPDPTDTSYITDYACLFRTADGAVKVEHDRHILGLFARADWLRFIAAAGFEPSVVPFEHSEVEPRQVEIFIGKKPF